MSKTEKIVVIVGLSLIGLFLFWMLYNFFIVKGGYTPPSGLDPAGNPYTVQGFSIKVNGKWSGIDAGVAETLQSYLNSKATGQAAIQGTSPGPASTVYAYLQGLSGVQWFPALPSPTAELSGQAAINAGIVPGIAPGTVPGGGGGFLGTVESALPDVASLLAFF